MDGHLTLIAARWERWLISFSRKIVLRVDCYPRKGFLGTSISSQWMTKKETARLQAGFALMNIYIVRNQYNAIIQSTFDHQRWAANNGEEHKNTLSVPLQFRSSSLRFFLYATHFMHIIYLQETWRKRAHMHCRVVRFVFLVILKSVQITLWRCKTSERGERERKAKENKLVFEIPSFISFIRLIRHETAGVHNVQRGSGLTHTRVPSFGQQQIRFSLSHM